MSSTSAASGNPSTVFQQYQAIADKQGKVYYGNAVDRVKLNSGALEEKSTWGGHGWRCVKWGFFYALGVVSESASKKAETIYEKISLRGKSNFETKQSFLSAIQAHYGDHGVAICAALQGNEQHGLSSTHANHTKDLSSSRIAKVLKEAEVENTRLNSASEKTPDASTASVDETLSGDSESDKAAYGVRSSSDRRTSRASSSAGSISDLGGTQPAAKDKLVCTNESDRKAMAAAVRVIDEWNKVWKPRDGDKIINKDEFQAAVDTYAQSVVGDDARQDTFISKETTDSIVKEAHEAIDQSDIEEKTKKLLKKTFQGNLLRELAKTPAPVAQELLDEDGN